jgi:hypothetical protein
VIESNAKRQAGQKPSGVFVLGHRARSKTMGKKQKRSKEQGRPIRTLTTITVDGGIWQRFEVNEALNEFRRANGTIMMLAVKAINTIQEQQ